MTTQENKEPLLPINQRVTHFDGGKDTHGKGTIVAYNGIQPHVYAQTNLKDAVELVGAVEDPEAKAMLTSGLISGFYDGTRCPYVIHWDPRNDDSEIGKKYPDGYKDVYERSSINPIPA